MLCDNHRSCHPPQVFVTLLVAALMVCVAESWFVPNDPAAGTCLQECEDSRKECSDQCDMVGRLRYSGCVTV